VWAELLYRRQNQLEYRSPVGIEPRFFVMAHTQAERLAELIFVDGCFVASITLHKAGPQPTTY